MLYTFKILTLVLLFSALVNACASAGNTATNLKGSTSKNILTHDGYSREYNTYRPLNFDKSTSAPLLLVLHGGGGTNHGMIKLTRSRFNELADIHNFIVVYPQGLEMGWNDGRNDLKQFASQNNIDDVGFIRRLIYKLQAQYSTDNRYHC